MRQLSSYFLQKKLLLVAAIASAAVALGNGGSPAVHADEPCDPYWYQQTGYCLVAPLNPTWTATSSAITVKWSLNLNATEPNYTRIYRGIAPLKDFVVTSVEDPAGVDHFGDTFSFTDDNHLQANTQYSYKVCAEYGDAEECTLPFGARTAMPPSPPPPACKAPQAPANVQAKALSPHSIELSWHAGVGTQFVSIYRSEWDSTGALVDGGDVGKAFTPADTTFTDTGVPGPGLKADTRYEYTVRDWSGPIDQCMTMAAPIFVRTLHAPQAPTGVTVVGAEDGIHVDWNSDDPQVTNFKVMRFSTPAWDSGPLGKDTRSFVDRAPRNIGGAEAVFKYAVCAETIVPAAPGVESCSDPVVFNAGVILIPEALMPAKPAAPQLSIERGGIRLLWSFSLDSNTTSYHVKRLTGATYTTVSPEIDATSDTIFRFDDAVPLTSFLTYTYELCAVSFVGEACSSPVSITVPSLRSSPITPRP